MKKIFGKEFFYQDPSIQTEFYLGVTAYYDLTITMLDVNANTFREYLVDFNTLREIYLFAREGIINPLPLNNKVETPVHIVKSYLTKDKYLIIASTETSMYGTAIIGNVMEIQRPDSEIEKVLSLKRIAYLPVKNNHVLGIDTIALPMGAAIDMMHLVKKKFKDVDIETDLLKGGKDAIN
jgi:hypothetical protein